MAKSFTAGEFVKALIDGTLKQSISKEGMVKAVEGSTDAIAFSEGMGCRAWIEIPLSMIDRVEFLSMVQCHDHAHPFVRLILKDPSAGNAEAVVFAEFAKHSSHQGFGPSAPSESRQAFGGNEAERACPAVGHGWRVGVRTAGGTVGWGWAGDYWPISREQDQRLIIRATHYAARNAGQEPDFGDYVTFFVQKQHIRDCD